MSRESKLAKNAIILSFGTIMPQLATIITLPILTGYLTKSEMGTYDLVTVLVSLILPAATIQIQTAAFRFLIDSRDNEEEISSIITNIVAFTIPTSLATLVVLFFCLPTDHISNRVWICLYFFADILYNTCRQICRGLGNNAAFSISTIIVSLGKMLFLVVFVYILRWGLLGTLVSMFIASFFSLFFLLLKANIYRYFALKKISKSIIKELLRYTWPMVPNGMSAWVMKLSDRLVVTAFMGVSANAIYSVANKIPNILQIVQHTFTLAWQENASIASKDQDAEKYYSNMHRCIFDLTVGFVGLLIAATPLLFRILIRGDYEEAYYQMPVLFIGVFFLSMSTFLGGIYVAYKKTKSVGLTTTFAAVINLIVDLVAIKHIGLYAASGSTLIAYIVLYIYRLIDCQKIVRIKVCWAHSIAAFLIIVVESVLCYMRKPIYNYINIAIGIVVFFYFNKTLVYKVSMMVIRKIKGRMKAK